MGRVSVFDRVHPLDDIKLAFAHLAAQKHYGKIIVRFELTHPPLYRTENGLCLASKVTGCRYGMDGAPERRDALA
jgi:hypothetical protein